MSTPSVDELRRVGAAAGLDAVGVARAEVFASTRADLERRKAEGLSADMQFTYRNPVRSTDPERALPGARSLVVAARSYRRDAPDGPHDRPAGSVARYAWEDHYAQLDRGLQAIAARLRADGWRTRVLADDNALVDREAAHRAGLGWYGKNANLLLPGRGSWFVLGSVVTDADLTASEPVPDGCGACTRCLSSCPTDAIVAAGVIDARRCLAWLVQARGTFPPEYREALGTRVYGCDDCQEVCPPNQRGSRTEVSISSGPTKPWVPLLEMLALDDEALLERHGAWYIADRDPRYLRRNALVALGNSGDASPAVEATVRRYLGHVDPLLRAHAVWAAKRLGLLEALTPVAADPDPAVVAELGRSVTPVC